MMSPASQSIVIQSPSNTYLLYNRVLGKGSYGTVLLCRQQRSNKLYAIKIISLKRLAQINGAENVKQEILLQQKMQHSNIVQLIESFEDENYIYLVMDYCGKGNMYYKLKASGAFSEEQAFKYFSQLISCVQYMHSRQMIHRDIKLENILITDDDDIKLCDFNWATYLINGMTRPQLCGTLEYMPPEVKQNQWQNYKVDVWSLGVVLYELLHNKLPFSNSSNLQIDMNLSEECRNLLRSMLMPAVNDRFTIEQIRNSKWIRDMDRGKENRGIPNTLSHSRLQSMLTLSYYSTPYKMNSSRRLTTEI